MGNICEMVGAGFLLVIALMSLLWVVYYFKGNAGIADAGWGLAFMLPMAAYLLLGEGAFLKRGVLACMVWVWGGRLSWHLYQRYLRSEEDFRYQKFRKECGERNCGFKFYMLFIFQGVLALLLTAPFIIVSYASIESWSGVELAGILVWAAGVAGEAHSDTILEKFRSHPENKGKICKEGLWKYSRHPNYFFECVVWTGFFLFALGTPGGWIGIVSPVIMLVLLTKVSGIPLVEAEAVKNRGDDYLSYQKTTSSLVPWFPKNE